jgi:hypothetical protein
MVAKSRRFVYGTFHWPGREKQQPPRRPSVPFVGAQPLSGWEPLALEILREYGANELIGKLYFKGNFNQWVPLEPARLSDIEWFKWFTKLGSNARHSPSVFYFDMEGSGRWGVLHFRNESDETGPYVALALRYSGS